MGAPPAYERQYSFTDFSTSNPSSQIPGDKIDLELNEVKSVLDATHAALDLIQRSDGQVKNLSIGLDQLKPEIVLGTPTDWVTATAYAAKDVVWRNSVLYVCNTDHTSGTFTTDLGNGLWTDYLDYADPLGDAADFAAAASDSANTAAARAAEAALSAISAAAAQAAAEAAQAAAESLFDALELPLAIGDGGTGGTTVGEAQVNLELEPGVDVQPFNAGLAYLAGLAITNEATFKSEVNLELGVDVQAYNANLAALAGLTLAADRLPYATGAGALALATFTAAGRALVDDADAAAQCTTLGAPQLGAANTYTGGLQTIAGTGSSKLRTQRTGQNAVFDIYHGTEETFLDASNAAASLILRRAGVTKLTIGASSAVFADDIAADYLLPNADNTYSVGTTLVRYTEVWAVDGSINTSDANEKKWLGPLPDGVKRAAKRILKNVGHFQWLAAIEKKGDDARFHIGVLAQDVRDAFLAEGEDPWRWGLIGSDELPDGSHRLSLRPTELKMLLLAVLAEAVFGES